MARLITRGLWPTRKLHWGLLDAALDSANYRGMRLYLSLLLFAGLAVSVSACRSGAKTPTGSDYAFEVTEQPGAFLLTLENTSKRDLCMPFSSWPGGQGHRGLASATPQIVRDGRVNRYAPNIAIDPSAPEFKRFKKLSRTTAQLRHSDFSFPVKDGDAAYLQFTPSVTTCKRFTVPPLNRN